MHLPLQARLLFRAESEQGQADSPGGQAVPGMQQVFDRGRDRVVVKDILCSGHALLRS